MALYTFFCTRPDGASPTFETHELASDVAATHLSHDLLLQHRSSSHIQIRQGDREVATTFRNGGSAQPVPEAIRVALEEPVFASASAALIATTADGTVVYWNEAAARLYGWDAAEAMGRNIIELTPALQSREQAEEIMRRLQRGEPWEGEIILRKRDGTPFKAFVVDVLVASPEGGVIVGASAAAASRTIVRAVKPLLLERLAS